VNKVTVIPLRENFLRHLAEEIVTHHYAADDPLALARVTILLPHRRGIVYLRDYFFQLITARQKRPILLPHICAIEDMVAEAAIQLEDPPRRLLSPPDQAWAIFGVVRESPSYGRVADTWDRFFPWGMRLAALLEEIDRELASPQDIPYPEDVPADAITLLEGLKTIYAAFDSQLAAQGLTTRGKRMRLLAEGIERTRLGEGPIYLAGFYALTRAEERIFRYLYAHGARILWHADPGHLPPLYRRWKDEWGVEIEIIGKDMPVLPKLHYYEAYDLHAELLQMQAHIPQEIQRPDQCALVLPDPSALIPVLYSLPLGMPVNISLGYPLERTALSSLLEQLMRLQEGRAEEGAYYHVDYLTLIRHPYLRRLPTPAGKEGRICLHFLEEKIRNFGKPFLTREELVKVLAISEDEEKDRRFLATEALDLPEVQGFVRELHRQLLEPWERVETPRGLAAALRGLVRFLFSPFVGKQDSLREHPLDNEFIYTLEGMVIPSLEDVLFADHPMDARLLFSLLREVIHMARTPFEGHPLVGLQVLGLLETRLLSFDKVIVIDVNEDVIPAHEEINPLLPEPLKETLGLKGREREEAIVRYHFERLISGAQEVHLFWQASTMPGSGGLEGKRVRSRFVEGLLWEEEKRRGCLLEDAVAKAPLRISGRSLFREAGLEKKGKDNEQVKAFLLGQSRRYGLSASLLNTYLSCPLKFYYQYLLGLRSAVAVEEDVDSALLGEIMHQTLERYFSPYRRRQYRKSADTDSERLISIFREQLTASSMHRCLAPEKRFFLEYAAVYRLQGYLSQMPETTFIETLEQEYRLPLPLAPGEFTFSGKVDRIDKRGGYRIILDYKTGQRVAQFAKGHFENRLIPFSIPKEFGYEGLKAVKGAIKDLQLPLYLLLVSGAKAEVLGSILAAYVELGRGGMESYFIPWDKIARLRDASLAWFSCSFPALLAFLIDHMVEASHFFPATEGDTCRFCEYEAVCRFSFAS
jgi:inactivated superfamily I helicase/RecB family exonuclease